MKNIKLIYKMNSIKIRNLKENLLVQENLIEKLERQKELEKFNDYLIYFKKYMESRARIMKIERLKMKINDVQMNLEKEMLKKNEDIKVRRKIVFVGGYKFDDKISIENGSINIISKSKSNEKSSKKTKKSQKTKKRKSKSTKNNNTNEEKNENEKIINLEKNINEFNKNSEKSGS